MNDPAPSFELVERELERVASGQVSRGEGLDTKAGLLLGFAGVLVTLQPGSPQVLSVAAQAFAATAALASAWAFWPRVTGEINPRTLRDSYVMAPAVDTRETIFATRVVLYEQDESRLNDKVKRMKLAMVLLIVSIALSFTASIVDLAGGDSNDSNSRNRVGAGASAAQPSATAP